MVEFPYTQKIESLKRFMEHIQEAGVPDKVTYQYLQVTGFKSSNDRRIISVLKAIGFIDKSGVPTEIWKNYRDRSKAPAIMSSALEKAYSELFKTYPNAQNLDVEALRNFFSAKTNLGLKSISLMVSTFKALCDLANFAKKPNKINKGLEKQTTDQSLDIVNENVSKTGLTININIQLTIPATDKPEVYANFFSAMKKYLLNND